MANEQGKLGTLECVMILVGGMVGSAVFSLSGLTYAMAGPSTIVSWIIGGLILLLYGLETAELCSIYPESGGIFVFPHEALGKNRLSKEAWGWGAAWSLLNVNIFGAAFSAIYVATYLGKSFPALAEHQILLAVIWCVVCGLLCLFNITVAGKVNLVMVLFLIALMLLYFFLGVGSGGFTGENFVPFFTRGSLGGTGFISAIPVAMLAYGAIVSVAFMVGQVKNPKKTVPNSMIAAMIIAIVMYCLVIVATIGLLAAEVFNAESTSWAQFAPLYAVAQMVLGAIPWLHYVITIAAVLALTTTLLVLLMTAGWTVQAAAAKGLLPKGLAKVSEKTGTPVAAMIICSLATLAVSCAPDFVEQITNCGAICNAICVIIISITLIAARKKTTPQPGNFRLSGGVFFPILVSILVVIFILPGVFQQWSYWAWALGWYVLGAIIFALCQIGKGKQIQ